MAEAKNQSKTISRRKIALVIGIGDYTYIKQLKNATNDANAMIIALENIGFTVRKEINPTIKPMQKALLDFQHSIEQGDIVLFYFAGHGVQWENENFLMPKENTNSDDANIYKTVFSQGGTTSQTKENTNINKKTVLSEEEMKARIEEMNARIKEDEVIKAGLKRCMIRVQKIVDDFTDQCPFITICLLDCCRVYFRRNPDLENWRDPFLNAEPRDHRGIVNAGLLIGFACAAGTKASDNDQQNNGLFTKHLLQHIVKPHTDIQKVLNAVNQAVQEESSFRQRPECTNSISTTEDIYLCEKISESVNLTGLFDPKKFTLSDGRRGRKQQIADLTVFELYKLAYAYCTFIGGQEIYDDDVNVGRKKEIEKYLLSSEQLLMESCKSVEKDYLKQLTETQLRVLMEEISYIDNEYDGIDGCFERIYASKDEENNTSSSTVKFLDINSAMRNWRERNAVRQLYRTQTSKMLNSSNNVLSITQSVVQVIPRLFIMNIALTIDFRDKSWTQAGIAAIGGLVRSVVDFASVATSASSLVATTATVYIEYFKILVFVAESLGVVIDQVRMYPYCLEEKISSIYRNRLKELSSKEHVFDDWKTIFPDLLSKFKDREKQNHCLSIMKCIDANFQMRKLLSKDFTLGVVGHGKNGKSTILKNMFGFNTNPDKEIRTEDLHSYRVNDEFRVVDFPHMTSVFDYVTNCFTCNHTPVNAVIVVLNAELSGNDIICEEYVVNKVKHLAKKGVHVLFCFNQCDKLALKKGSRQISGNIDECSEYGSDEIQQIDTSTENDVCEYWTEEYVEKKRKEWAKNYQIDLNKCWMTFCDLEETNTAKLKENYNRLKSIKLRTYLDIKEMWLKGVLKDNSLSENSINEIMNFRYGKQQ